MVNKTPGLSEKNKPMYIYIYVYIYTIYIHGRVAKQACNSARSIVSERLTRPMSKQTHPDFQNHYLNQSL